MTRYAGLEIDANTLRIAIFEGTPKSYSLVEFIEEEITAESAAERGETVRGILADLTSSKENQGMQWASSIDARDVVLREISVPYTRDDHIAKTIKYEAESYIHSQNIEDVVVEYLKCSESEDSSRLVLSIAPKTVLADHLEHTQAAGVDPEVVELDATALATAFGNTPLYSGEQNVLLVELEAAYSRLVFLEKDRVVKIRSFWDRPAIVRHDRLLDDTPTSAESSSSETNGGAAAPESAPEVTASTDGAGDAAEAAPEAVTPEEPSTTTTVATPAPTESGDIERRFEEIERTLSRLDRQEEENQEYLEYALGDDIPVAVVPDDEYERLVELNQPEPVDNGAELAPAGGAPRWEGGESSLASPASDIDPMERVFVEIERTFAAYALTGSIDLMVVTGSRSRGLDAVNRLAEHFEVDVVPFDLGDSFPIEWSGDRERLNSRGAVACGLGLRALGQGITTFDLRKEEYKFERRLEQLMPGLMLVGFLLWVVALVWSFQTYVDSRRLEREVSVLQEWHKKSYETFFQEPAPNVNGSLRGSIQSRIREISRGGRGRREKAAKLKSYFSAMSLFHDVTQAMERARVTENRKSKRIYPVYYSFEINTEKSKNTKSKIELKVKTSGEASAIRGALTDHLKKLTLDDFSADQDRDGLYKVNVDLKINPSELPKSR